MKLEIRILDDQNQVVAEYRGDPAQPGGWRAQAGQRLVSKMPQQSDNQNTGTYELFGFTYQPHLRVDRPNGYTSPTPSPNNGPSMPIPGWKPMAPPTSIPKWGPSSPTAAPAPSATNLNSLGVSK